MSAFLRLPFCSGEIETKKYLCVDLEKVRTVGELMDWVGASYPVQKSEFKLLRFGHLALEEQLLQKDDCFDFLPRNFGGKGGFGSMLRAIGAQIEKTTNREACRDLSGRRMRDVNNEKNLKDWISKKVDRERERERIRRERLARRHAEPKHNFDDPNYENQKSQAAENLEDALQKGLKKSKASATVTSESLGKRGATESSESGPSKAKISRKSMEWMGIEGGSDLDSNQSESDDDTTNDSSDSTNGAATGALTDDVSQNNDDNSNNCENRSKIEAPLHDAACSSSTAGTSKGSSLLAMLPPPSCSEPQKTDSTKPPADVDPASVCLENYSSAKELEQLGLDVLKSVLMLRGLKCGGTLKQRAERLFSVKGLKPDEIDPSLVSKNKGKGGKKK